MNKDESRTNDPVYENVRRKPIRLLKQNKPNSNIQEFDSCNNNNVAPHYLVKSTKEEPSNYPGNPIIQKGDLKGVSSSVYLDSLNGGLKKVGYTKAELAHKEVQKKRIRKQIESRATMTHRQRVSKFNEKLSSLPEHFDIPKVGPG
ncbi:protein FAM32A-like [Cryptosporidium felis]|nr:protein FAM32A-like [Cryptosporidium felis]